MGFQTKNDILVYLILSLLIFIFNIFFLILNIISIHKNKKMLGEANILFKIYYFKINFRNIITIIVNLVVIPILISWVIVFGQMFFIFSTFEISYIKNAIFLVYFLIPAVLLVISIGTIISVVYLFFRKSAIIENYIVLSNNVVKMGNIINTEINKNIIKLYLKNKSKIKFKANEIDINNIQDYILSIMHK